MARWEKPNRDMPAFRLADTTGKVWYLKRLEGKTVVVGIWASWSAPCHSMLPKFQQLYEQMKDRPGIEVISFNVDEDQAPVAPFIEKNGFTFPVVPSFVFVGQLVGFLSVPRVWIIDAKGNWQWEQVGYDLNDKDWEPDLLKRIEAVHAASAST